MGAALSFGRERTYEDILREEEEKYNVALVRRVETYERMKEEFRRRKEALKERLELIEEQEKEEYQSYLVSLAAGDQSVKTKLAWYLLSGHGGAQVEPKKALEFLVERVKDGDPEAMWMLAGRMDYESDRIDGETLSVKELYNRSYDMTQSEDASWLLGNYQLMGKDRFCLASDSLSSLNRLLNCSLSSFILTPNRWLLRFD